MKKSFLFFLVVATCFVSMAQQSIQISQVLADPSLLNPAFSGLNDYMSVNFANRRQWVGMEGAPESMYMSFDLPFNKRRNKKYFHKNSERLYTSRKSDFHHGFGGLILNDKYGAFQKTKIQALYSFHLSIGHKFKLAFSPRMGLGFNSLNTNMVDFKNQNDGSYYDFISAGNKNKVLDFDFGLLLYSDFLKVGYSMLQIIPAKHTKAKSTYLSQQLISHNFFASKKFIVKYGQLRNLKKSKNTLITPFLLFRMPAKSKMTSEIGVEYEMESTFKIGTSYRINNASAFWLSVNLSEFVDFSYCYDIPFSKIRNTQSGTHELMLKLKLFDGRFEKR